MIIKYEYSELPWLALIVLPVLMYRIYPIVGFVMMSVTSVFAIFIIGLQNAKLSNSTSKAKGSKKGYDEAYHKAFVK